MALRVEGARRNVNRLMNDACKLWHNQDHKASATLNEVTLKLEPEADPQTYYRGGCFLVPTGRMATNSELGGIESSVQGFIMSIPHIIEDVRVGDEGQMTKALDPALKDVKFVVRDIKRSSFHIWRQFTIEILETSRG